MTDSPVCWQFLVKLRKAQDDQPISPPELVNPKIDEVHYVEASNFINQYEWLGNVGAAQYCFGLRYSGRLAAVVCFARPTSRVAFASLAGLGPRDVFQLCRGASTHWAPKNVASMLIAWSLRRMEAKFGAKLIVAYADPAAGEIGTVYQAANAMYLGPTDSRGPGVYVIKGKRYHPRTVHRVFGCARHSKLKRIDPNYKRFQRTKKHRYIFLLGSINAKRRLAAKLKNLFKPYPKRKDSGSVDRRSAVHHLNPNSPAGVSA
jgi:hypothetical protein